MRYFLVLLVFFATEITVAQEIGLPQSNKKDSIMRRMRPGPGPSQEIEIGIKDYKIIGFTRDTTFLDTTLTIKKEYKYNYLRKDNFEQLPFANIGRPSNSLGVTYKANRLYPSLGAKAVNGNYLEVDDVEYYHVPTPMTELMFKTTLEQGQLLDALLTFNTSPRLNFSIAYKGFRSLGKYQLDQVESGNFRFTSNYVSKNDKYSYRGHIAAQDIINDENGGLLSKEAQFESGDSEFTERSRVDVKHDDGQNKILGKRYFFEHQYKLIKKKKDSGKVRNTDIAVGHVFNYETKYYQFQQTNEENYFGNAFLSDVNDKARLKTMYNQFNAAFNNNTLGLLKGYISMYNYNYFFNSVLITPTQEIQSQLKGQEVVVGANYKKTIGGFELDGEMAYTVSGDFNSNFIKADASYKLNDKNSFKFGVNISSAMPNYNYLLYQSDYENYNWQNTDTFKKQNRNSFHFDLNTSKFGTIASSYNIIDNYTYFASEAVQAQIDSGAENAFIKPQQEGNSVSYLKVKYNKEFKVGRFALDNTVMYQNVSQSNNVLNVPQLVTRNTLYFSKDVFRKAMFLQTGITFKYFTSYYMNAYNPVLGEFYVQDRQKLGGYPMLDFFINAKVQQTRIFLKAEHFNSSFTGYNFYSAPDYPYRDFVIRFGLVWNFFS